MEFNKLVFAGLSVGCLAAAAGGSYLAVRQNQSARHGFDARLRSLHPATPSATAAPTGHRIGRRDHAGGGEA